MSYISNKNDHLSSKELVKRLLNDFISKYYKELALSIMFMIIVAATTALHAWMMKPILDKIFTERNASLLIPIAVGLFSISVIKGFSTYFQQLLTRNVENNILIDIQRKLFAKLLVSDVSFTTNYSTGKIISHFTNDVNVMRSSMSSVLTTIVREFLSLVFLMSLIFYYIPKLAIITFFIFPIAVLPIYFLGKKMRKISTTTQKELGIFTSQLDETIEGIKVVKAHNAENIETKRVFNITENLKKLYRKSVRNDSLISPIMETLGGVALAVIIAYGGHEVINGKISTGTFFLFITAVLSSYKPMKSITKLNNQMQQGLAAAMRIFNILDTDPKIIAESDDKNIIISKGNIKFDKVEFYYPNSEGKALKEVSFSLEKGKIYALVGKSGSGKTTIMNLILRFYDATKGKITIDNHSIKDFSFENLRSQIAYVSQEIFLFDDSVKANICYGLSGDITDDEIIEAAKKAEAHTFISELEQGYDTVIGPKGCLLSGGQKQRIVIARSFLRNAPILLLDEATSALDPISEQQIRTATHKLREHRTCLVIAHNQETILNADKIMVMRHGEIIASGTHEELLKNSAFYKDLFLHNQLEQ